MIICMHACCRQNRTTKHTLVMQVYSLFQVGAGGAYHSWTPLYPDFCEEDKMRVLINICDLRAPTRIMLNRPGEFDTFKQCH